MMRSRPGAWFFDGYKAVMEPRKDGNGMHRVLVYKGEWYGLKLDRGACRRIKLLFLALSIALSASYLLISFFPSTGGMSRYVGIPCLLTLVPLIFFWIGMINFLPAGEKWELRVYYAGYRRVKRAAYVILCLMSATFVSECVYLFMNADGWSGELLYLAGAAACLACVAAILLLQKRAPAVVVQGPVIE
jgi:hypothetical protein